MGFTFSDHDLARRLETAEGRAGASFVECRAKAHPACGAEWIEVAGARAMFDGVSSPVTQTFGLGMSGPVTPADLDRIEDFFSRRGAPVHHEISPLADPSIWPLLTERRYQPFEFTSVLFRDLPVEPRSIPAGDGISARVAGPAEMDLWVDLAAEGWGGFRDFSQALSDATRAETTASGVTLFIAEHNSRPIATGALNVQNGVAILAGGSTIPDARRLGAQSALLRARLEHAAIAGCSLAMMGAEPGSASQRNAERNGFRIAYTRTKWRVIISQHA